MTYLIMGLIGIGFFGITIYWNTVLEILNTVVAYVWAAADTVWTKIFG